MGIHETSSRLRCCWRGEQANIMYCEFLILLICVMSSKFSFVEKKIPPSSVGEYVGDFHGYWYNVGGQVYVVNDQTIQIENFSYSGGGPAAYFWAGTEGEPNHTDETTTAYLAYPFLGKHYTYWENPGPSIPKLKNKSITLTLPPHMKARDVRWISVWCKPFRANFGQILIPENTIIHDRIKTQSFELEHSEGQNDMAEERNNDTADETTESLINNVAEATASINSVASMQMTERQGKSLDLDKEGGLSEDDLETNDEDPNSEASNIVKQHKETSVEENLLDAVSVINATESSSLAVHDKHTGQEEVVENSCKTVLPTILLFLIVFL